MKITHMLRWMAPLALLVVTPVWGQGTLFVEGNNVGINVETPDEMLHVQGTSDVVLKVEKTGLASDVLFELVNNGTPRFLFRDTNSGFSWLFEASGSGFFINELSDGASAEFRLDKNGNLVIEGSLTVGPGGCTGCDLVFSPDYQVESIEEHAAYMWEKKHLPGVGPTPEDQPMNLSEKTGGILNELEKAHIYIEELAKQNREREAQIAALREELAELKSARMEAIVSRLADIEAAIGSDE